MEIKGGRKMVWEDVSSLHASTLLSNLPNQDSQYFNFSRLSFLVTILLKNSTHSMMLVKLKTN